MINFNDDDHLYDGYHSLSNLQDELTLEKTTIFYRQGYNKECNCACLKVGYKETRQFFKSNDTTLPADYVFLTNWPYAHPPICDDEYENNNTLDDDKAFNWQQPPTEECWCKTNVKFIEQKHFIRTFPLPHHE